MAKKKTLGKYPVGSQVRVKDGVPSPEFPDISLGGWIGTVAEVSGKAEPFSYVLEWTDATLQNMPPDYVQKCEQEGLYHAMACLSEDALESA